MIVGTSIDAVLGHATTEVGPVWRQRQLVPISRLQTLISKWVMAADLTVILTGLMLFTAVVILGMNSPDFLSLWLLCWFAAMVVAIGTLFEPLRQILDGVRAILYFDGRGDAGLTRAWIASVIGLVLWVGVGLLVTTWYDRKRLYRMPPDLIGIHRSRGRRLSA